MSVVVPTFNYGRLIGETIASLRGQTWTNWECVIVDDGSTDGTPDICRAAAAVDRRIRYIRQDNRGHPAAKNAGVAQSRGQYLQFLDADDLIERDKLRRHAGALEADPGIDIVYGPARYFTSEHPEQRFLSVRLDDEPWMPGVSGRGAELLPHLLRQNLFAVNCPVLRRRVFDDVGGFDECLPRLDDWDFWLRCALAGKSFRYRDLPETTALVRCHAASLTRRKRDAIAAQIQMRRKLNPSHLPPDLRRLNAELVAWLEAVNRIAGKLDEVIPAGTKFLLADQDQFRPELMGFDAVPFTESGGHYDGPPVDAAAAIAEIDRRRAEGIRFLVFLQPAFWWLDHYSGLSQYLQRHSRCVHKDDEMVVLKARCDAGEAVDLVL